MLNTKEDSLEECRLLVPIDFHSMGKYFKVSVNQKVFVYPTFFKISSFVFNMRKRFRLQYINNTSDLNRTNEFTAGL